jgi:hypothetical protein
MADKGLGDKNMDFLLGLDMLKRFRCNIDLGNNVLMFTIDGKKVNAPFCNEFELPESKGGTKGFNADSSNAEMERVMKESEEAELERVKKESSKDDGGGGDDAMDVENEDEKKPSAPSAASGGAIASGSGNEAEFRAIFDRLVATGMNANDAAVEAIKQLSTGAAK